MKVIITLTDEQNQILNTISNRTGRTKTQLLNNYLSGFINTLKPEAERTETENEFKKLTVQDRKRAIELIKKEKNNIVGK